MSDNNSSPAPVSALEAIVEHVNATTPTAAAVARAVESAREYGIATPDAMTAATLTALANLASARRDSHPAAVIASPAAGVVGLHVAAGIGEQGVLTCIDAELEHQALAKEAFREGGIRPNRQRFLPSEPLEVMQRLAPEAYDFVYLDVAPTAIAAARAKAWPLLRSGGIMVIVGSLLDGTVEDDSRSDRDTVAAREADAAEVARADSADADALLLRLPVAAGTTVLVKK